MGNLKAEFMNGKYVTISIEEYFNLMDKQVDTNKKVVAKSLIKYLKSKNIQQVKVA